MSLEQRKYFRIYTDVNYQIGEDSESFFERINISAGGAAFIMAPALESKLLINQIIEFYFTLNGKKFMLEALVLRIENRNGKKYSCITFKNVPEKTRKNIDEIIHQIGGYYSEDKEARDRNLRLLKEQDELYGSILTTFNDRETNNSTLLENKK